MAHFAQLTNNLVTQVIVVSNEDTSTAQGQEKESIGVAFCERLFGGDWKQTSYRGTIRKNYAGIGYTYDPARDAFYAPQPYPSWSLDADCHWQAPTPMPTDDKRYAWDEATLTWVEQ